MERWFIIVMGAVWHLINWVVLNGPWVKDLSSFPGWSPVKWWANALLFMEYISFGNSVKPWTMHRQIHWHSTLWCVLSWWISHKREHWPSRNQPLSTMSKIIRLHKKVKNKYIGVFKHTRGRMTEGLLRPENQKGEMRQGTELCLLFKFQE